MDLIKKLSGKNPDEYNYVAKLLVDNADTSLFAKLVEQDDFLFDFIKNNIADRIQKACTQENYKNLIKFWDFYSSSYDLMMAEVLYNFGGLEVFAEIKQIFITGNNSQKAYALKFFTLIDNNILMDLLPEIRLYSKSSYEPLSVNAIEVLAKLSDELSKNEALDNLNSNDEFVQYNAVKFLVNFQDKSVVSKIIETMKRSSLAENIASEIPYLIPLEELITLNFESAILVLCNIINAIPDIISPSAVIDYNLYSILSNLSKDNLNSSSATLLMLAKTKFAELISNDEYLYDCDKNTKNEVIAIENLLRKLNTLNLKNLLYDELYEDSEFVFFAIDYVDNIEVLESLIDSKNPTLILKTLSLLKEKFTLTPSHKELALKNVTHSNIANIVEAM